MIHRFSSQSDTYSVRKLNNTVSFVWNTTVKICQFSHLALIHLLISPYKQTDDILRVTCNLVQTDVVNPHGVILSRIPYKARKNMQVTVESKGMLINRDGSMINKLVIFPKQLIFHDSYYIKVLFRILFH